MTAVTSKEPISELMLWYRVIGSNEWLPLDTDYTYGGKSALFGGNGAHIYDEKSGTIQVATCVGVKSFNRFEIGVARTAKDKRGEGYMFDLGKLVDWFECDIPAAVKQTAPFSQIPYDSAKVKSGLKNSSAGLEFRMAKWNLDRDECYLVKVHYYRSVPYGFFPRAKTDKKGHKRKTSSEQMPAIKRIKTDPLDGQPLREHEKE